MAFYMLCLHLHICTWWHMLLGWNGYVVPCNCCTIGGLGDWLDGIGEHGGPLGGGIFWLFWLDAIRLRRSSSYIWINRSSFSSISSTYNFQSWPIKHKVVGTCCDSQKGNTIQLLELLSPFLKKQLSMKRIDEKKINSNSTGNTLQTLQNAATWWR